MMPFAPLSSSGINVYGTKFGKVSIAVPPQYMSQTCSNCGEIVKKSLSTRTHECHNFVKASRFDKPRIPSPCGL